MNRKRIFCLLLAALLGLMPLVALAETDQRVRNEGLEAVGVYAQIGDPSPARRESEAGMAPGICHGWAEDPRSGR